MVMGSLDSTNLIWYGIRGVGVSWSIESINLKRNEVIVPVQIVHSPIATCMVANLSTVKQRFTERLRSVFIPAQKQKLC